jgi:hypothetical protein
MYPRRGNRGGETHHGRASRSRPAERVRRMLPSSVHGGSSADRGAVAVEFALLLPFLLLIVLGIIDFGRMLNAQETLTQSAREGARLAAFGKPDGDVRSRTIDAATGLNLGAGDVSIQSCAGGAGPDGIVETSYSFTFTPGLGYIVSLFGGTGLSGQITLSAKGVMPCET